MMSNQMGEWWGFGMGFGWLIPLILIGLVVWGIVTLTRSRPEARSGNSALAILKERYARGEISREEFETMRQDIS